MDDLIEAYASESEKAVSMKNFSSISYSAEFYRGLKAIPCPYHNYYYFTQEQLEIQLKEYKEGKVRGEVVLALETELFELYKDLDLKVKPKQLESRGGAHYSDAACSLINSIYNDSQDIQYVNTKNNGAITNLPYDSVIEAACIITGHGPVPLSIGELDYKIMGTIQNTKAFELMVCEAAVTGNKELAIAALASSPLCSSVNTAKVVVEELIAAHKEYLPQF